MRKLILAIIVIGLVVSLVGIGVCTYWIYSNTVTVNLEESELVLSETHAGLTVILTATGVKAGETVAFGTTTSSAEANDGTWSFIDWANADGTGTAVLTWTAPSAGVRYFSARADNLDFP